MKEWEQERGRYIALVKYVGTSSNTGNMPLPGTRTDGEQTLRRVGHSSPDLCRVKKEKSPLTSTTNSYTMSFATKFSRRFVVSPYAARPIGRRLSEPPPPDANTELQEYEWKVALQTRPLWWDFSTTQYLCSSKSRCKRFLSFMTLFYSLLMSVL